MPHRSLTRLLAASALACAACTTEELSLPDDPSTRLAPVVESLFPVRAYAGQRLRLTGRHLAPSEARLYVGGAGPLVPSNASDDGTSLEVVIPDDATSGPVLVETNGGRAQSGPFTMLGPGRPLQHRNTASLDLRPVVEVLGGTGPGDPVVRLRVDVGERSDMSWAVLGDGDEPQLLPWQGVLGAWVAPDRAFALTVRREGNRWMLERRGWPDGRALETLALSDPDIPLMDYDEPRVMADPAGTYVIVAGAIGTFFVRRGEAGLERAGSMRVFGEPVVPPDAAWLGGGRFAVEQRGGVALVDVADPAYTPRLFRPDPSRPFLRTLALARGGPGELAVGSIDYGSVRFFRVPGDDAPLDPAAFTFIDEVAIPPADFLSYVAVTAEGDRVAISTSQQVQVLSRDPLEGPLVGLDTRRVLSLVAQGRTFLFGDGAELVTLSAHTGAYLGRRAAAGQWTPPLLGYRTCPGDIAPRLYVETVSRTLRAVRTFDAENLTSTWCGPIRLPVLGDVVAALRHPWRDERYVLSERPDGGAILERYGALGEVTGRVSFPSFVRDCSDATFALCRNTHQLVLSTDGTRLAVWWSERSLDAEYSVASILDAAASWDDPFEPFEQEFPTLPDGFILTRDRLVLSEPDGLFGIDISAIDRGGASITWEGPEGVAPVAMGMVVAGDDLAGDQLFAINAGVDRLGWLLDLEDGALLETSSGLVTGASLFMSPGRQSAYWMRRRAAEGVEMGVTRFDPDGRVVSSALIGPIPVPQLAAFPIGGGRALRFEYSPDGARAWLGGERTESILVFE